MAAGPASDRSAEKPGAVIARLRRRARVTGQQLGQIVGMSQAKISRIETGHATVTPADAAALARALDATAEETDRLIELARRDQDKMTEWRPSWGGARGSQAEVAEVEAQTRVFRVFQPGVVVGLAQTAEYARRILTLLNPIGEEPPAETSPTAVARAVSARVRRQEVLTQPGREFHFLMGEAALSGQVRGLDRAHMSAQIARLRELGRQDDVILRFLRADAETPLPLLHGFELLDDTCVVIDVFNTAMVSRGPQDVAAYRAVFDRLEQSADADANALLDQYQRRYQETAG